MIGMIRKFTAIGVLVVTLAAWCLLIGLLVLANIRGLDAQSGTASSTYTRTVGDYRAAHISTNATTVVKASPGFLGCVTINTAGATGNTATVYDNTSAAAPVIATINTTAGVETLCYNVAVATGLTVVTATGTAANLTVTYR